MDEEDITATLLRDMFVKAIIGHAYRPIQKIIRFFPPDRRGEVKRVIKKLIRTGFLLEPKMGAISLNSKRITEIKEIIIKMFPELKEKFFFGKDQ